LLCCEGFEITPAFPVDDPFGEKHIPDHTNPERYLVIFKMIPVEQIENDMIYPEGHRGHCHCIAPDHPDLVSDDILLQDGRETIEGGNEPEARHKHKQAAFPKTPFGEE
jgi:hypothetical protein